MDKRVEAESAVSPGLFPLTHWSAILPAGQTGEASLATVYEIYREPLLLYLLCLRHKPEDAADLVQGFFANLLRYESLADVSPRKGRFRTFLITSLKHYLSDQRDRVNAAKRGGGQPALSLEDLAAREHIDLAMVEEQGPEWAYDRAWASAVLKAALRQLEQELLKAGKSALFTALAPVMHQDAEALSYRAIADKLDMSEGAVKVAAKRLRDRLGHLIRQEVRRTVADPQNCQAELRYLIELLGMG